MTTAEIPPALRLLGVSIPFLPESERNGALASYKSKSPMVSIGETTEGMWYAFAYLRRGSVTSLCLDTGTHATAQKAADCLADQILMLRRALAEFGEADLRLRDSAQALALPAIARDELLEVADQLDRVLRHSCNGGECELCWPDTKATRIRDALARGFGLTV